MDFRVCLVEDCAVLGGYRPELVRVPSKYKKHASQTLVKKKGEPQAECRALGGIGRAKREASPRHVRIPHRPVCSHADSACGFCCVARLDAFGWPDV